ncbi:MAG: protease complex subunit PrcB family protein [Deinococcus sp.]|uniref:protease complex subunit PrcB family protein n=1 Tax=Deinococcus sp. TaxID=47478 RepID=UPI0026DAFB06|nr:protease complex subunit PrcB family protein [Deinococcus sp.]MDO4246100.1 protease complex subunit PrcB family protein [Deinococcus sp.]
MISAPMSRFGLLALTGLLMGCTATGPGNLRVHEATIYGAGAQRIVWVYGDAGTTGSSSLKLGSDTVTVRPQTDGGAVPGSLSVNGKATYTAPVSDPTPRLSLSRDNAGNFTAEALGGTRVKAVYYTDGRQWQQLASVSGRTTARTVTGLRGSGNLTDAEADVLTRALSGQGPLAIAVLDETTVPDAPIVVEPKSTEQRRTALYVLPASQITTVTTSTTSTTTTVTPTQGGQTMNATEVARGTNAAAESAAVVVARTSSEVRALYNVAYGRQTGSPSLPSLRPGEALVGIFIGQRGTGGYGVGLNSASMQGNVLNLKVELTAPKPGGITTQALTSPWVIVKVTAPFSDVQVTDQSGRSFPY